MFEVRYIEIEKLEALGASVTTDNKIEIKYKADESIETLMLSPLEYIYDQFNYSERWRILYPNYDDYKTIEGDPLYCFYKIDTDHDLVHFVISECVYNETYKLFLKQMFSEIEVNHIRNIVVDLRGNYGGDSAVIESFLSYVDLSELMQESASEEVKSEKAPLFQGNLYVLTDQATFSSAMMFTREISDMKLGVVIGQPTGGRPTAYGEPIDFVLPNSQLNYGISSKYFTRPERDKSGEDTLYPDYQTNYTIEDYINHHDLDMEKVIELIKLK